MYEILDRVNSPEDVKKLDINELKGLAQDIRDAMMNRLSKRGGHFGPNFGIVETTIAMHYVFDSPKDKIVFDVSHQCYPHKILTGRKLGYISDEHFGDVSGYTNPEESAHDFFNIGHTSTSVSLAAGLAKGRDLTGGKENIIAVIGDGSLSGGEALEGIDFAGEMDSNFIIVVNDNDMSIAENHGGMYKNLKALRDGNGKAETNLFTAMGLDYVFVADGNDIEQLIEAFKGVKDSTKPVVVHIVTKKGKGYPIAENNKENWHWSMPFDPETGKSTVNWGNGENYGSLTADYLTKKMDKDKSVCAITAATPMVFGFDEKLREKYKNQFFDVGIAEETATALASGIARNGGKPVFGVNSTFMQRTYDQIMQDVCLNSSPVTFLVFSASVYGMSDVTHIGIYDIPMISNIPGLVYLAPTCAEEYIAMLDWFLEQNTYPVAIRVPGNGVVHTDREIPTDYSELNKSEMVKQGEKAAVIAVGGFYQIGEKTVEILAEQGINAALINPRFVTGLDIPMLDTLKEKCKVVITLEDGSLDGGFGQKIAAYFGGSDVNVRCYGLGKEFYDRYNASELLDNLGITPEKIASDIIGMLK
ncbi:1-deoxy-D-xylulose-5-phosphate synthase [Ruminococcus albus]|uniref:1-deoxy-D-xylulose-5-phosphate synthase n=1 Tax=Ruminococcus albus TaxID=1264 RepID=A0A1H7F3W0_RUMAL|nr:1-deoxy-D-xylulose-5-phosphate synthase [Ruminococcus albus]SEK20836.1 1-deoxy-D-xylulose-5-phosphate synthase [Ruminococcus albus]